MTIHSGHDSTPRAVNLKDMPPAPTDETVVVPPPEHRDDKHDLPWYRKRGVQIGGAATALVAAGLTVFALNNGPAEKTEPKSEPVASAPANPGGVSPSETASATPEQEKPIAFIPISAAELSSPDNLRTSIENMITNVQMVGADAQWAKAFDIQKESPDDYAAARAVDVIAAYKATYFDASATNDPATVEALNQAELATAQTLSLYLASTFPDPQNVATYERTALIEDFKLAKKSDTTGLVSYIVGTTDNRESNVAANIIGDQELASNRNTLEYVVKDGKVLITKYVLAD